MSYTEADLARIRANPDITVIDDDAEPTPAARELERIKAKRLGVGV